MSDTSVEVQGLFRELSDTKRQYQELFNNYKVLNAQHSSSKEILGSVMNESINTRANFMLANQYLEEAQKLNKELSDKIANLEKENDELKKKLEASKPADSESPVTADAA